MPSLVGPSHYVFYSAMMRRQLWLQRLTESYYAVGDRELLSAIDRTRKLFSGAMRRSEDIHSLGIQKNYTLDGILDDTPVDSFLARLYDDVCAFEAHVFDLIQAYHTRVSHDEAGIAIRRAKEICVLWGREVAGEKLLTPSEAPRLRDVFENLYQLMEGGDLLWKPLLQRRLTQGEVEYELRCCPHVRGSAVSKSDSARDFACQLEGIVFEHFAKFFVHDMSFLRTRKTGYCMDKLHFPRL